MKQLKYVFLILLFFLSSLNAKELEKVSLQFLWIDQFQFAGYYVAKEKGFYKDVGLEVELKPFKYGINVTKEVLENKSTYAIGRSSLIIDKANGAKIKLLAAIFQSSPLVLLAMKDSGISNVEDFVHKKIMTTDDASTTASLIAMMKHENVDLAYLKEVKHSFNIQDLVNHKTDLMASYISNEPFILEELGLNYIVFDPKDYGFDFYSDILFTSDDEIKTHEQRAINFRDASLKGWVYAFNHIDETVDLILKKYNKQQKSKKALIYEAKKLKKLAYYKNKNLGSLDFHKIQRIYDIYNVMGLLDNKLSKTKISQYIFQKDDVVSSILSDNEKEYIRKKNTIKICVIPNALPYSKISKGKYIGMGAEYMDLVSKKIGVKFTLVPTSDWEESLEYIKVRKCDLLPIAAKTPSREEYLNFTSHIFSTPLVIVTRNTEVYISNITKVLDKKLGVAKGHSYIELLKKIYPDIKLVEINSNKEGLRDVSNGTIYAMIGDLASIAYEIQRNNTNNLKVSGSIGDGIDVGMGVRNDDMLLLNILNKAIYNIYEIEKQKIYNKWISVEYKKQADYTLVMLVSIFFIFMILFGIYRQRELNKYNQELRVTQDNFNLGQKIAGIGIWILDHKKNTLEWTDGVYMIFGTDRDSFDVNPDSFMSFIHEEDKEKVHNEYTKSIKNRTIYFIEHRIVLANSQIKYVEERCTNFYTEDGDILKSIGTILDITQRKIVQIKLSELNNTLEYKVKEEVQNSRHKDKQMLHQSRLAQMGEMISMIAHQWRQPLGAISATAIDMKLQMELETFDLSKDEDSKLCFAYFMNSLNSIDGFVKGLTVTIDDFRNFYKPNKESFISSINIPIDIALKIVRQNLSSQDIQIIEEYDSLKDIEMYTNELVQVFLNIFKNAQDNFLERGIKDAKIIINTQNFSNGIIIKICDNGGGIAENIKDKIFDPYFSTKDEKNGSGLGLYMSKMIIEEHHKAKLNVSNNTNSQGFCIGACFSIELSNNITEDKNI